MRRAGERAQGFPQRLQALVNRYGSIEALAKASGIGARTIGDWLRGVREPHPAKMRQMSHILGISTDWLELDPVRMDDVGVGIPPDRQIFLHSIDGGETIGMVSAAWLASRFGIQSQDEILLAHSPEDIPPYLVRGEPVLLRVIKESFTPEANDIVLVEDSAGIVELRVGPPEAGKVVAIAIWVGRSLRVRARGLGPRVEPGVPFFARKPK